MIVAHNALFLSSAARTEPQNALGPHHGDQHAAEQGKEKGQIPYPLQLSLVHNHVEYQHDHAAGNAEYCILVQGDEVPALKRQNTARWSRKR